MWRWMCQYGGVNRDREPGFLQIPVCVLLRVPREEREILMLKVTGIFAVVSIAGSAIASPVLGDYSSYGQISSDSITAVSLEEGTQGAVSPVYSNMEAGAGFNAFPAANGGLGFDDYTSTSGGPIVMESIRFVGGVDSVDGVLNFEFFDAAGANLVTAFSVTFAQAGNFIWTINLGGAFTADAAGVLQISTDATSVGQWFLSAEAPTVGSEDNTFGGASGGALSHKFEINVVPAPGALALLGLGGIVAGRRRR